MTSEELALLARLQHLNSVQLPGLVHAMIARQDEQGFSPEAWRLLAELFVELATDLRIQADKAGALAIHRNEPQGDGDG